MSVSADLYANELVMAANLAKREKIPANVKVHFFRPGSMVVMEWIEDAPSTPQKWKWRHLNIATGEEISDEMISERMMDRS